MANALFDWGRQGFLDGSIDWDTDTIKVRLLTSAYTRNLDTHDFLDDTTGAVGTDQTLTGKTVVDGIADADDATWTALSGSTVTQAVIYKDTGVAATSRLIASLDTVTGFPFAPSGGDFTLRWDNGANKIFKL